METRGKHENADHHERAPIFPAFGLTLAGGPALAQGGAETRINAAVCVRDGNGYVSKDEADQCADQEYSTLLGGDKESLMQEDLDTWFADKEGAGYDFTALDADQSGDVSREAYRAWRGAAYDETAGGQEMSAEDYDTWHPGVETGGGDSGADESSTTSN